MKSLQQRLGIICALATVSLTPICKADVWDKKTKISIDSALAVPGAVLSPGTYVLKLVNSSSNRHIVMVMNDREDHTYSTSFTASAHRLFPADKTILTFYEGRGDQPHAIRTWYYPGDVDGQEFIYPKDRAQLLAVSATTEVAQVPANAEVELKTPEPAEAAGLTPAPIIATPPAPTEQAETPAPQEPVLLAQNQEPPRTEPAPTTTESTPEIPTSEELPKTASDLPLIALSGLSALGLALGLRRWERRFNQ